MQQLVEGLLPLLARYVARFEVDLRIGARSQGRAVTKHQQVVVTDALYFVQQIARGDVCTDVCARRAVVLGELHRQCERTVHIPVHHCASVELNGDRISAVAPVEQRLLARGVATVERIFPPDDDVLVAPLLLALELYEHTERWKPNGVVGRAWLRAF